MARVALTSRGRMQVQRRVKEIAKADPAGSDTSGMTTFLHARKP